MSNSDKFAGKAKETAGKATGNEDLKDEGQTQHAKGDFKEKTDDAKNSARGAFEGAKEKLTGDDDRR